MKFVQYPELGNCIRVLAADAIKKANSGHPGMVLGLADVMTSLVFDFLNFNPDDPKWFNRDRLVLSAGHGSMLLYAFYYLAGYKDFTLEDIKNFRRLHSKTPGHPEYEAYPAIEATTGPLGQGLANAVGMAIAQKKYRQKLGSTQCDYKIYCIVGDGCLMEGISYEASALAGHLGLNNLIVLFDDNGITIDGKVSLAASEDHQVRFKAQGWNSIAINGHNFEEINQALKSAQNSDKPYFIACRTTIAKGCTGKEGSEKAHGAPLSAEEIILMKSSLNMPLEEFSIPGKLKELWERAWLKSREKYEETKETVIAKPAAYNIDLKNVIEPEPTRMSSGRIIEQLRHYENIIFGSADLSYSNNIKTDFNKPITKDDFSGNFIHFGIREHAMAAIMNGLALSGFLPVCGTFLAFSDYMKPAIRLSALMKQQVIYIMTHDSIGLGEDGPTHQPVEHLTGLRAMPNLLVLRPADYIETAECWQVALENTGGPSMLVLTRQSVAQVTSHPELLSGSLEIIDANRFSGSQGVLLKPCETLNRVQVEGQTDVTIFASGSEVSLALDTAAILKENSIKTLVVSIPSFELFFQQDKKYINKVLTASKLKVAIEAASSFGWHRIIGENGLFFGVNDFGFSAPAEEVYKHFGLTAENIADIVKRTVKIL